MTDAMPYQYVVLRCVPRVDREEFVNIAVVLYCEEAGYLSTEATIAADRIEALHPGTDIDAVRAAVRFAAAVCEGSERLGPAGDRDRGSRFGLLRAPRSTVVQPGPVHGGTTTDPAAELRRLREILVDPPQPGQTSTSQTGTSSTAPTA